MYRHLRRLILGILVAAGVLHACKKGPEPEPQAPAPAPGTATPPTGTTGSIPAPPPGGDAPPAQVPAALPAFPWPVPLPSAMASLPFLEIMQRWRSEHSFPARPPHSILGTVDLRDFYRNGPKLSDANYALRYLLAQGGYEEVRYYAVPGGFAMVTRLERINSDGVPTESGRWDFARSFNGPFTIADYLRALFIAPPGYYRIIVFVLTPRPISAEGTITGRDAEAWFTNGGISLPDEIGKRRYTEYYQFSVLIYEFERSADEEETSVRRPGLPFVQHLKGAKLEALAP